MATNPLIKDNDETTMETAGITEVRRGFWSETITDKTLEETKPIAAPNKEVVTISACQGRVSELVRLLLGKPFYCSQLNLFRSAYTSIGNQGWKTIGRAVGASKHLEQLTLVHVAFSDDGMAAFARHGLQQSTYLKVLKLELTSWDEDDNGKGSMELAKALANNPQLETLHLAECGLEDGEMAPIVRSLIHNESSLVELKLSGNKFAQQTSVALAELLQSPHCKLQRLHMNNYGYQHRRHRAKLNFELIASALQQNGTLCELDLAANVLDDKDLDCLAQAIMSENNHNSSLETLDLACNKITDAGLSRLLNEYLPQIHSLHTLDLTGNLTEAICISKNTTLTPAILKNQVIQAMVELKDVALIKAAALPERIPPWLWPRLLYRLQILLHKKKAAPNPTAVRNLFYQMLRGPVASSLNPQK